MLYLTGCVPSDPALRQRLFDASVGFLHIPDGPSRKQKWTRIFPHWAADTGLYTPLGVQTFDVERYLDRLSKLPRENCLFALAPDVYADGPATLAMSLPILPRIRELGFPAGFVLQPDMPEIPWGEFDVLFVGGTDRFRQWDILASYVAEAKARRKKTHLGRVNSAKRYLWGRSLGFDSADGTHLAFGPNTLGDRVISWVSSAEQLTLEDIA